MMAAAPLGFGLGAPPAAWCWCRSYGQGQVVMNLWRTGCQAGFTAAHHRTGAWLQAFAACCQKSRISAGGVGPAICSWLSKMVTAPADASMCAAVPVPPTQP
jgi:hypothetical protein